MDPELLTLLVLAAVAAGWIDAIVGGGGLLLLPALLVAFPNTPVATLLGTNKLAAMFGTCSAAVNYSRGLRLDAGIVWPTAGLALAGSGAGAAFASMASSSSDALRPIIMAVLLLVAVMVVARPALGAHTDPRLRTPGRVIVAVLVAGLLVSFYDGIIGPGTGTFLMIALTTIVGMDFVQASASAKIVNTATNLGALCVFTLAGHVMWLLGLVLAGGTIGGALIGSRMALRRGTGFVRVVLLVVVVVLLLRLGYEHFT
ncbi:TSUP family transporter [Lipingzhangella sp. LS1_29]|uniref:Probable membrane transporter protein n=1 Tax=Lipingzhangella rawalii TaxID=2055835 RepID=A0ABU2H635_9ACTN|nr:TSUP family transporter [Lipingzhangella rawalii]MDS1270309.1 TSUP family transporter [Lipingzhangella rawalii]